MTEAEWLACEDSVPMLRFVLGEPVVGETVNLPGRGAVEVHHFPKCWVSDRGRRLFLCAYCRAVDPALTGDAFRAAVETTERYLVGLAPPEEVVTASKLIAVEVDAFLDEYLRPSAPSAPRDRGWRAILSRVGRWAAGLVANDTDNWSPERFRRFALDRIARTASHVDYDHSAASGIDWVTEEAVWLSLAGSGPHGWQLRIPAICREVFGNPFRPVAFSPDWRTSTAVALAAQMYESRDFSAMPILADALQDAGCDNDAILNHCRDANQVHVRGCWVVDLVLGKG